MNHRALSAIAEESKDSVVARICRRVPGPATAISFPPATKIRATRPQGVGRSATRTRTRRPAVSHATRTSGHVTRLKFHRASGASATPARSPVSVGLPPPSRPWDRQAERRTLGYVAVFILAVIPRFGLGAARAQPPVVVVVVDGPRGGSAGRNMRRTHGATSTGTSAGKSAAVLLRRVRELIRQRPKVRISRDSFSFLPPSRSLFLVSRFLPLLFRASPYWDETPTRIFTRRWRSNGSESRIFRLREGVPPDACASAIDFAPRVLRFFFPFFFSRVVAAAKPCPISVVRLYMYVYVDNIYNVHACIAARDYLADIRA